MDAYIIDACRTPRGRRGGGLAGVHPIDLCTLPMKAIVARSGVDVNRIEDAMIGCVTETGEQGACIGRAAVLTAGWPVEIPGFSLIRFCGSGQTTVNLAAQGVASGAYDLVYAGGVESMSRCPMGSDMGSLPPSLTERYNLVPQGLSAEMIAERWSLSRTEFDEFALESQRRAWQAIREGRFEKSLVPMREVGIPHEKVNVNGGAIALGHPLGATGAMLIGTLLDELERTDKTVGLSTMCIGYGMGIATIIERV